MTSFDQPAAVAETAQIRSLTSAVFSDLKEEILSCRLKPGEKLHIGNLAKGYGVSLAAVREALSRLVSSGLVVAEDQRGFRVSPTSVQDMNDLTETRIEIECLVLRRSIERGGADWVETVQAASQAMSDVRPGSDKWTALHKRFHEALGSACGLDWLMRFRALLFERSERYRALSRIRKTTGRDLAAERQALMDAALARDTASATRLLTEHLRRTRDLVLRNYPDAGPPPVKPTMIVRKRVAMPAKGPSDPKKPSTSRGSKS